MPGAFGKRVERTTLVRHDPQKKGILDRAMRRYGGLEQWRQLEWIELEIIHLGGLLPWWKGLHRSFPLPPLIRVSPHQWRTAFAQYPTPERVGVFEQGQVGIFPNHEPTQIMPAVNHRDSFRGLRKLGSWSHLDALYFFGYSMCTYLSVPFVLQDLPSLPCANPEEIRVVFPARSHTHCEQQSFFFDQEGLQTRHHYRADVIGPGAYGAHLTKEFVDFEGFPIATHRIVYARPFGVPTPFPILEAYLRPVQIKMRRLIS